MTRVSLSENYMFPNKVRLEKNFVFFLQRFYKTLAFVDNFN